MSRRHHRRQSVVNNNVSVTTVTNAQIVNHYGQSPRRHKGRNGHHDADRKPDRKAPKLARFCASGGLLDRDVASKMSDSQLVDESFAVIGYAGDSMGKAITKGVGGVCKMAEGALGLAGSAVRGISWYCSLFD